MFSDFKDFVREQGVVGLAVGLAIGAAAGEAVKSIVTEFINPIVGFILGGGSLAGKVWDTGLERDGLPLIFGWGTIVAAIITLLATAFVIYFIVKKSGLDKLDKESK